MDHRVQTRTVTVADSEEDCNYISGEEIMTSLNNAQMAAINDYQNQECAVKELLGQINDCDQTLEVPVICLSSTCSQRYKIARVKSTKPSGVLLCTDFHKNRKFEKIPRLLRQ